MLANEATMDHKKRLLFTRMNTFIKELEEATKASRQFVEMARPVMNKLHAENPSDRSRNMIESFRNTAECQARAEATVARALVLMDDLGVKEEALAERVLEMKRRMLGLHAQAASILLRSYGGFGGRQTDYEA